MKWFKSESKKFKQKFCVTEKRLKEAEKIEQGDFFKIVLGKIIESIKKGLTFDYLYITEDGISYYKEEVGWGKFSDYICEFCDLHYKNLTDEQVVALYIALERTGYFEYRINVHRKIAGLILTTKGHKIKTYAQIAIEQREAKKRSNLKDIY